MGKNYFGCVASSSVPIGFSKDVTSLHEVWLNNCLLVLQHRVVSAINKHKDQKIYLKNEWTVRFLQQVGD